MLSNHSLWQLALVIRSQPLGWLSSHLFRVGILLLQFLVANVQGQDQAATKGWSIGPEPLWVDIASIPARPQFQPPEPGETTRHLLVDEQVHAKREEYFTRRVYEVLDETGVQENSTISVLFQPDFQTLILHHVQVWRGAEAREQLDPKAVRLVERESDASGNIYRGEARAFLVLSDIRIGDRIEYSYTIRGRNPVLQHRYAGGFLTGWTVPLAHLRFRLIWPEGRRLNWRAVTKEVAPQVQPHPDGTEMIWSLTNQPSVKVERNTPSWYPILPWVQLSDFQSWSEVAAWAAELFPENPNLPPALEASIADWIQLPTGADRAQAALQFVQNEIRYVGIEIGVNSHQPADPLTVLTRRFGDCKDMTQLLISILNRLGLRARPLLVNSAAEGTITNWWPSPYAFNHAVVLAELGSDRWLLDPTLAYQRGPLTNRFVPRFGAGLIAARSSTQLEILPDPEYGTLDTRIVEEFRVGAPGESSELVVTTRSSGLAAEIVRAQFAVIPRAEMESSLRDFYLRQYKGLEATQPVEFQDLTNQNRTITIERYGIPELWTRTDPANPWKALFFPSTLSTLFALPDPIRRQSPLAIVHPRRIEVSTRLELPSEWTMKDEQSVITSPATTLSVSRTHRSRSMQFDFTFQATSDFVPPEKMEEYAAALRQMDSNLGYELTRREKAESGSVQPFNWLIFALAGVYSLLLVTAVGLALWLVPRRDSPPPVHTVDPEHLTGIGGWLVLVAIQVCIAPLTNLGILTTTAPAYSAVRWSALTTPGSPEYHPLLAPVLIGELLGNLTFLAVSTWLLVLFWQRHRWFPKVMIVALIGRLLFTFLDEALSGAISQEQGTSLQHAKMVGQALGTFGATMAWVLYFIRSVRVKRTFVR